MITVDIDTREFTAGLSRFTKDQVPFAMANTLNSAAWGVRGDVHEQMSTSFTIAPSKERWMRSLVRVPREDRARKDQLEATVGIYDGRNGILSRHIDGGERTKYDEVNPFFIPSDYMRPNDRSLPQRKLYPKNLRLMDRRTPDGILYAQARRSSTGRIVARGKHKTFVAGTKGRPGVTWGVYQRQGPERDDIQLLWLYRQRIELPRRLDWQSAVERQVARIPEEFVRQLRKAMLTARPAGLR